MSKQPNIDQLDLAVAEILANPDATPSVDASLADLLLVARDLRDMPAPSFKARLRSDLERKTSMSTKTLKLKPGFRAVTPYLVLPDGSFLDFAKRVFGAEETAHFKISATAFHAELRIGDSMLMVGGGVPDRFVPANLIVRVPNSDEVVARAIEAGATSTSPMFEEHGDRFGLVQDPSGNRWCISTPTGPIPSWQKNNITVVFSPPRAGEFIAFLKAAFDAEEVERHDSEGKVMWATIGIGDSVIGVSDGDKEGGHPSTPAMIRLYVPDCDATYAQAMRAGAQSVVAPADQPYGERSGGVVDPWGNEWHMATPL